MATTNCGYCRLRTHMTVRIGEFMNVGTSDNPRWITQILCKCDHCGQLSIATVIGANWQGPQVENLDRQLNDPGVRVTWTPRLGISMEFPDVPSHIASAASEAHECASIGANRAAILLARTVIEASAKSQGITTGNLHGKIQQMEKDGTIRSLIVQAAMGVKDFGNDMAHGDIEQDVTDEDVVETLELMGVILNEVFQIEARTRTLRKRVADRKASSNPTVTAPDALGS